MLKGIKLRLYPNAKQRDQLTQMFGNNRFIWNIMLNMANERYKNNPSSSFIDEYGMNYLLPRLKREYPFLKKSEARSLQISNHYLAQAFKMLFKHQGGHPKFKSRKAIRQSYTGDGKYGCRIIAKRYMRLPKLGCIKTSKTSQLEGLKIKRYTVALDPTGRYYLSLMVDDPNIQPLEPTGAVVGIDMGVADLAITSDGYKYPKFEVDWYEQQANKAQSRFSKRKQRALVRVRQWNHNHKDTKMELDDYSNWQKARVTKSRYQAKIANKRKDYLHKITTELVKSYDVIVIEDLKTKNLLKNHSLAKSIANNSWYLFREMLEYKCKWYGKKLIKVSPNYTSQICSNCGYHSGKKPLEIREWTCPKCNTYHDRDINASINILNRGLKELNID